MKRPSQPPRKTAPLPSASAHAESLGDFAQARKLSLTEIAAPGATAEARDRYLRLAADPLAWRVFLGAMCAYTAVWFYALTANR